MNTLLVLVHPGSACGSAAFNLGSRAAAEARHALATDLDAWTGAILVVDGTLSDELGAYLGLQVAIEGALARARGSQLISDRVWGCDVVPPHQDEAVRRAVQRLCLDPGDWRMSVTGAWSDSEAGACVDDVADTLRQAGFQVEIRASALVVPASCV